MELRTKLRLQCAPQPAICERRLIVKHNTWIINIMNMDSLYRAVRVKLRAASMRVRVQKNPQEFHHIPKILPCSICATTSKLEPGTGSASFPKHYNTQNWKLTAKVGVWAVTSMAFHQGHVFFHIWISLHLRYHCEAFDVVINPHQTQPLLLVSYHSKVLLESNSASKDSDPYSWR